MVNHDDHDDALLPRLRVIEEQPLEHRAEAYAQVHDELTRRLEGGDSAAAATVPGDQGAHA
ncbi:hypothetical protein HL652_05105 [Herbiconiux sp. SALV-R1]|nr:hypothetical protein [Herbiconiux sp. SALV-R1]QJU55938.1 hypothetical protein HL652_05105 [Herbiconiux sp. SALV-R1]